MSGVVSTGLGLVLTILLVGLRVNRLWRLALFLPFAGGASGYFQAKDQTCVGLAARGERNMDSGAEKIEDHRVLNQVRMQARKVQAKSVAVAAVVTLLCLLIPSRGRARS